MKYPVGSTVIHPQHGTVKVVGKSKKTFGGKNVSYLELEVLSSEPRFNPGMKIMVVESKASEAGLRQAATAEEAQDILEVLGTTKNVHMPTNWSRRYKNHISMLATGDIFQIATVVRNLYVRTGISKLSAAERALQKKAEHLLSSELAVTWDITSDEALVRMKETMAIASQSMTREDIIDDDNEGDHNGDAPGKNTNE